MKLNVIICGLVALAQVIPADFVQYNGVERPTLIRKTRDDDNANVQQTSSATNNSTELFKVEPRENSDSFDLTTVETVSPTTESQSNDSHKIPPALLNTNVELSREKSEKPSKSLKDFATPTSAQFHPKIIGHNIGHERVKQAIINSKQNAFRYTSMFNPKNEVKTNDQVAKSNEVKADVSKENPIQNPKEFLPSPEVSPLYNRENEVQNHFAPMNHYYRPTKQDAQFPTEKSFSSNPQLDTRWLGGNQQPHDFHHSPPHDYMRPPQLPQGRHTQVKYPFFGNYFDHHHHQQQNEDRVTFPSSENSNGNSEEPKSWYSHQVPALNFKQPKGTWKWIPEEDDGSTYQSTESTSALSYETPQQNSHEFSHQTSHDRPYSFVSPASQNQNYLFHHHSGDTSSAAWPSSPSGSESLLASEEYPNRKHQDFQNIDVKQSRNPWKKIIHVMTAAIPIGLIISALTPRIVYVHPNATAPVLQQPLPPSQQFPSQQFPTAPGPTGPNSGQVNGPFPQRQRVDTSNELINQSLTNFLKVMEAKFQEKHLQLGEKLDGSCEDRFFCEIALRGRASNAADVHRTLYHVALETPEDQARNSGLGEIFHAIKRQDCRVFQCNKLDIL